MEIYGKEYGFMLTVEAQCKIASMCDDNDLSRISEKLSSTDAVEQMTTLVGLVTAMSEGYEDNRAFFESGYTPAPLTADAVMKLTPVQLGEITDEAMAAFNRDAGVTVEAEAPKGKKTESGAESPEASG